MPDPTKAEQEAAAAAAAKAKAEQEAKAAEQTRATEQTAALAELARNLNRIQGPAAPTENLDETVKGGKFWVKDRAGKYKLINSNGREIDETGKVLHPEEQQVDAFGRLV